MLIRTYYINGNVSSRKKSQTVSKVWSKVIQADCGDNTLEGSKVTAVVADKMLGTLVVKVGDEVKLNFGATPLFTLKYKNTCTYVLRIANDKLFDAASPSFISVVQADRDIIVSASALNSYFPMPNVADRPTMTFTYYLRAETPENYKVFDTNSF